MKLDTKRFWMILAMAGLLGAAAQRAGGQQTEGAKQEVQAPAAQETTAAQVEKKAPSVEELAASLKSGPGVGRMEALRTILSDGVKDKGLLSPLLAVVADGSAQNKECRPSAMRALVNLKGAGLTPAEKETLLRAVMDGIKDDDADVQSAAIPGVGAADTAAIPALLSATTGANPAVKVLALRRLALVWSTQLPPLKGGAPPAPPEVLNALEDADPDVRAAAAMAFWAGGFKDRAAIPSLLKLFGDATANTPQGRADAIHALGSLRSDALSAEEQKAIVAVIEQGLKDPAPPVRYYAAWSIQRTDGALSPAIEPLLSDLDPRVRAIAQEKLYQLRLSGPAKPDTARAPEGLLAGLADPSARARAQAVRAFWLGGYKDPTAVNPLLNLFADKSDENRIARLDALRALAFLRTTPLPDEMKNRIVGAILLGLNDPYFAVRYQAAKAITPVDAVALPALREAEKDEYPLVQGAAKEAIERLGKK